MHVDCGSALLVWYPRSATTAHLSLSPFPLVSRHLCVPGFPPLLLQPYGNTYDVVVVAAWLQAVTAR